MDLQKVLVTGGNGFLGTHLVPKLKYREWCADVVASHSTEYDLRNQKDVQKMFSDHKPDIVIHLAASVGGIGANREHPGKFFYENLMMGVQTMHQAHLSGVKKFVALGTICAYPKFTPVPFKEENLWDGYPEETNAPYGIAKKALLVQAQAYRQEYGFNAIYLLPVNLYGPGDNFDLQTAHVVPTLIRKFSEAKENGDDALTLWGDGSPTREFFYVDDCAEGILLATEKYDKPDPINLGSGEEISIKDLADLIAKEVGFTGSVEWDTSKPNGQPRRRLDVSRAKAEFGFEAQTPFLEGLRKTIAWYRENCDHLREIHF
ncbi:GDP-L-fucose synthase [Patescibacteria group bacterium]|nr:GDP-L-fucose synthase [Patescibacteria group bacterium]